MVLRCSLLGHDYGDAEVEREREERGSEVVVTVQEYEECSRCGDRTVLSENTEVRSLSAEAAADPDAEPGADAAGDEDVELLEDESEGAAVDEPEPDDAEEADEIELPTDENGDPVTDDGEILEDDDEPPEPDRERGEWPDSDDVGPPVAEEEDGSDWPDRDDPEAVEDDGVILEDDETGPANGGESIAAETAASPADAAPTAGAESGTGIQRAGSAPAPGKEGGTPTDGTQTEFYCPRCDFVAPGDRGSLRNGDICPECRKGYLSERDRR